MINQSVLKTLKSIVGPENLLLDQPSLEAYSMDALGRGRDRRNIFSQPEIYAVVRPTSTIEVSEITKVAHAELIPLIPYGGGTGVAGAVVPLQNGLTVDLKGMHRIVEINAEDRTATVEAGIILGDLDNALRQNGLMLGHDPYSVPIATMGGAISTNGVGYRASKYGSMGEQVLGLEIVLPNGDIVQTRAIPKSSTGPSIHSLFIGSEGVFGIITRATIRVFRLPESRLFKTISFSTFEDGFRAMLEMFSLGLKPALIDLTEEPDTSKIGATDTPHMPYRIWMYLVFEGYSEDVRAQVTRSLAICATCNGKDIGPDPAEEYWNTRHASAYRYKERYLDKPAEDWHMQSSPRTIAYPHVAIPASKVLEYRRLCQEIASRNNMRVLEYALWTQPELFSMILVDIAMENSGAESQMTKVIDHLLRLAHDMGGSMEYVHGVGVKLIHLMPEELGASIDVLRGIKASLDPHNIMNPGKLAL